MASVETRTTVMYNTQVVISPLVMVNKASTIARNHWAQNADTTTYFVLAQTAINAANVGSTRGLISGKNVNKDC